MVRKRYSVQKILHCVYPLIQVINKTITKTHVRQTLLYMKKAVIIYVFVFPYPCVLFYPTAFKGCVGTVFTNSIDGWSVRQALAGKGLSGLYLRNHRV